MATRKSETGTNVGDLWQAARMAERFETGVTFTCKENYSAGLFLFCTTIKEISDHFN